jgi:hypothetical protein
MSTPARLYWELARQLLAEPPVPEDHHRAGSPSATDQAFADERGGKVQQLLRLAEGQAA